MKKIRFLIILCVFALFLNCGGINGNCNKAYTDCVEDCKKNAAIQASFGKEYNYDGCINGCENNYDKCSKGIAEECFILIIDRADIR